MRTKDFVMLAVSVIAAGAAIVAAKNGMLGEDQPPPKTPADVIPTHQAVRALNQLQVAPAGPMVGYDREQLFPDWADLDDDGCSTREEVLMRQATEYTTVDWKPDACVGWVHIEDPYGQGPIESLGNIQIDHVVSLAAAWRSGGHGWTLAEWETFANDPSNLLAVEGGENQSKGDSTPDEWLPPENFRCGYAKMYAVTSDRYDLSVTQSTKDVLAGILKGCAR